MVASRAVGCLPAVSEHVDLSSQAERDARNGVKDASNWKQDTCRGSGGPFHGARDSAALKAPCRQRDPTLRARLKRLRENDRAADQRVRQRAGFGGQRTRDRRLDGDDAPDGDGHAATELAKREAKALAQFGQEQAEPHHDAGRDARPARTRLGQPVWLQDEGGGAADDRERERERRADDAHMAEHTRKGGPDLRIARRS